MLKNVLSLLLSKFYSKKDASEIAALALPNHLDNIAISVTEGTNTYVAPADGYINFITARNGGVNVYGQCLQTNSYPSTNRQAKAFVPISKGKQIIFEISGETISATFYKLIGGGYQALKKLILQGGGLCLNSLSSSLRRSSCRVRRNGSEVKVFSQTQIPEQRSLLTTLRLNFLRLQVMDGLHSAETDHRSMSALPESWERVALTLKVISELQLRFGRGIPLVSIARRTISNRLRQNSFPAKGQRNTLLVGGASC